MLIKYGEFIVYSFVEIILGKEYVVLVKGDIVDGENVFICIYLECLIGDVFGL